MRLSISKILISLILFISLFGGLRIPLGLPDAIMVVTELLIYLLLIVSLLYRNGKGVPWPHLGFSLLIIIMISICSIVLNQVEYYRCLFSLRLLYRFYIFYLAIIWLEYSDDDLKKLNSIISIFFVLEFPVVLIKLIKYGISERTMGAYSTPDGSLTTTIPITIIFFAASFYSLYSNKIKYIIIGIGYILVAIAGAKRAVLYLFPVQFLAIYFLFYFKAKNLNFLKKIGLFFVVLMSAFIVTISILYFNKSLNPQGVVGGSVNLEYALNYTRDYMTGVNGYGYSYGRTTTTIRVFDTLWKAGTLNLLLGMGPGIQTPSFFDTKKDKEKLKNFAEDTMISYGMTSFTKIAIEYGLLGVINYLAILIAIVKMCSKFYSMEKDPYWKAFAAGSVCVSYSMLFFFFAYNSSSIWGDTLPALYFYIMAVSYTRLKRIDFRKSGQLQQNYHFPKSPIYSNQ